MRRWLPKIAIGVAVFASVATSKAPWIIRADVPESAPSGDEGLLVSVESSQRPEVLCRLGAAQLTLDPQSLRDDAEWPGKASFLCPPGGELLEVALEGRGGGGMCSKSEPPEKAFVKVTSVTSVPTWQRSASVDQPFTVTGDSQDFEVEVASSQPARVMVSLGEVANRFATPVVVHARWAVFPDAGISPDTRHYSVFLSRENPGLDPISGTLQVRATAWATCPSADACEPKEVRIVSVIPR